MTRHLAEGLLVLLLSHSLAHSLTYNLLNKSSSLPMKAIPSFTIHILGMMLISATSRGVPHFHNRQGSTCWQVRLRITFSRFYPCSTYLYLYTKLLPFSSSVVSSVRTDDLFNNALVIHMHMLSWNSLFDQPEYACLFPSKLPTYPSPTPRVVPRSFSHSTNHIFWN